MQFDSYFSLKVPAEFDDNAIAIMSECAIGANLIERENSERNLKFITERKFNSSQNYHPFNFSIMVFNSRFSQFT